MFAEEKDDVVIEPYYVSLEATFFNPLARDARN